MKIIYYLIVLLIIVPSVVAPRYATVGGDEDTWGYVVNDLLNETITKNGSLYSVKVYDDYDESNLMTTINTTGIYVNGSEHRFYTNGKDTATEAYLGIRNWNFLGGFNVAEIYAKSDFVLGTTLFSSADGLYLRGVTITDPLLVFADSVGTGTGRLKYVSASDRINFELATGGYRFDNDIEIDSDSAGLFLGAGQDYRIYSNGAVTVFNGDSNNVDSAFLSNTGSTLLRVDADAGVCVNCDTALASLTVNGDSRFGSPSGSRTQISASGVISQVGLATAQFNEVNMNDNNKILFGSAEDASIYYNTADLVIKPDEVGTGSVKVLGDVNVTKNFTGNQIYGSMWTHNDSANGIPNVISVQGVWINLTGFNQTTESGQVLNGFSFDSHGEYLQVQMDGRYDCSYDISVGNTGNNQEYQFMIAVDDVPQDNTDSHRKIGSSGDVGDASDRGFLDLNVDDRLTLQARNNDGIADLELHSASINCLRIGDII